MLRLWRRRNRSGYSHPDWKPGHVRAIDLGPGHIGTIDHGPGHSGSIDFGPGHVGAIDVGPGHVGAIDLGPGHVGACDVGADGDLGPDDFCSCRHHHYCGTTNGSPNRVCLRGHR